MFVVSGTLDMDRQSPEMGGQRILWTRIHCRTCRGHMEARYCHQKQVDKTMLVFA